MGQFEYMHKLRNLELIELVVLIVEHGNYRDHIEDKGAWFDIVLTNCWQGIEDHCLLDKVKQDVDDEQNVDKVFYALQFALRKDFFVREVGVLNFIIVLVKFWIDKQKWHHKQMIDDNDGDDEVPNNTRSVFSVNKIPLARLLLGPPSLIRIQLHWMVLIGNDVVDVLLFLITVSHYLKLRVYHNSLGFLPG